MRPAAHLSFYALDRLRLGDPATAEESVHLAACAGCAAYVGSAAGHAGSAPAWMAKARLAAPGSQRRRTLRDRLKGWRAFWPALTAGAAAVAVAAGLLLVWPGAWQEDPPPDIREKGLPGVQVFVKRGERVFSWNGQAIRPGDRLRVEVNGGGFGFVSVAGRSAGENRPVLLYDGALASGAQLLPLSFRVDAEGKQEILSVIFGRRPVPVDLHARADEAENNPSENASTWRQILVIEKEAP